MEDIRLGRKITFDASRKTAVTAVSTLVLPANPSRVFLILSSPGGQTLWQAGDLLGDPAAGLSVSSNTLPIMLDIRTHGILVTSQWNVTAIGANSQVTIIEGYLGDK